MADRASTAIRSMGLVVWLVAGVATGAELWRTRTHESLPPAVWAAPASLAPMVRSVKAGVVNLRAVSRGPSVGGDPSGSAHKSLGSGMIINPEGLVVTNGHVVDHADEITVQLADGRELPARLVGQDSATDLALLEISGARGRKLPYVYFGDSDRLEVGDWVVAIGNPFGLDHSVSHGMISAKERNLGLGPLDDFIQTDALINRGNSGGPLFNLKGEVVGVNTAVVSQGQGIGFAVPINLVKDLLPQLKINGRVVRGWMGVKIHEATGASGGAVVQEVVADSPAEHAGVRVGDRLVAVNGVRVESYSGLLRKIQLLAPGTVVRLAVARSGATENLRVRISERPPPRPGPDGGYGPFGLRVAERGELPADGDDEPRGRLVVSAVAQGSPGDVGGIRPGDVLLEVNGDRVSSEVDFLEAVQRGADDEETTFKVVRGGLEREVTLRNGP